MANDVPGEKDARYRLLGLQAIPHDDGVIIRRGTVSVFVRGERARELLDILIARSAEGRGIALDQLKVDTDLASHPTLINLIETLRAERLLVATERVTGPPRAERREEVFYWSHGASHAEAAANVADVALAIFGVNHIALALFGNLRSCGFRNLTFIDHPALRNLDFFEGNAIRSEIASALSVRPQAFDEWSNAPARPDCHVVCSDFGGLGLMREWNRNAVAANMLFYPIVLQDEIAYLGPLVVPGEGPCFECLWARQNANLEDPNRERAGEMHAFFGQHVASYVQPMARAAADLAAIDLLKYFSRTLPGGRAGRLIEADLMAPALRVRNVLKVPRCPVCSRLPAAAGPDAPAEPSS